MVFPRTALLVIGPRVLYHWPMRQALIKEIFSSIQGEGPYVGQRHLFIRFIGCDLRCQYCDTPGAVAGGSGGEQRPCRAQRSADAAVLEEVQNPIGSAVLTSLCSRLVTPGPAKPVLSLTGGEPLLQAAFLRSWLPEVRGTYRIYLETNGIHHAAMRELDGLVDVVSMDIKLPSATGQGPRWDDHRSFLKATDGIETFVKVVVTSGTAMSDILMAAKLVEERERRMPFIIQPCSGPSAPSGETLIEMQSTVLAVLEDVRVIPQIHPMLRVP